MTLTIDYQTIIVFLCIFSLLFSGMTCMFSLCAYSKVIGLTNSTHNVQYVPMDHEVDRENEEFIKTQHDDNWATSEGSLKEQYDQYVEERDELMPEFSPEEDDMKVHSF